MNNNLEIEDNLEKEDENTIDSRFSIAVLEKLEEIDELCKNVKFLNIDFMKNILSNVDFPITVLIDNDYVDKVYRDSYYIYLSSKHFNYGRNCKRLSLFQGKYDIEDFLSLDNSQDPDGSKYQELNAKFIGITVVRPSSNPNINRTIGRTLLDPKKMKIAPCSVCTTRFEVNILGIDYTINAFPFMAQDSEVMKCAETTVWGMMEYYGTADPALKTILPSDIIKCVDEISKERNLPSNGLTYTQVTNLFKIFGFEPKLYNKSTYNSNPNIEKQISTSDKVNSAQNKKTPFEQKTINSLKKEEIELTESDNNDKIGLNINLKHIVHYYALSAIPFAMGLQEQNEDTKSLEKDGHSVICVGCGNPDFNLKEISPIDTGSLKFIDSADFYSDYVIMDDNKYPFCIQKYDNFSENMKVDIISVPLNKHIFLDAPSAAAITYSFLIQYSEQIRKLFDEYEEIKEFLSKEPVVTKLFLTSSSKFQSYRISKTSSIQEKYLYLNKKFPKHVWVCELSPLSLYKKGMAIGEIILDATSYANDFIESVISVRFGKYEAYHSELNENWFSMFNTNDEWSYKFPLFKGTLTEIKNNNRREASL